MPLMTTFEHAVLTAQDFVYAADFDWLIEQNFIGLRCSGRVAHGSLWLGTIWVSFSYPVACYLRFAQNCTVWRGESW